MAKQNELLPAFDQSFLEYHAGRVIQDPQIAIVELVANAWDAGATKVQIFWPQEHGDTIAVEDNGAGMTLYEFKERWPTLNYDRTKTQGSEVTFPPDVGKRKRSAFGRNGVGRHAMFCFANSYTVDSKKEGRRIVFEVEKRGAGGSSPFKIRQVSDDECDPKDHGTAIRTKAQVVVYSPESIAELIGTRFVADPDFEIHVNGSKVELTDLEHLGKRFEVPVEGFGNIVVRRYAAEAGKSSKQHGVAWWVTKRLVGEPSWAVLDSSLLDARSGTAKRLTYVAEVDPLKRFVKKDWTGFQAHKDVKTVMEVIGAWVSDDLRAFTQDIRRERKRLALTEARGTLRKLGPLSQEQVAKFADEVQIRCPTITEKDFNNVVTILTKLEESRAGYSLLERIATLKPDELDQLDIILEQWTVADVKLVLEQLHHRLVLITKLEKLIDDIKADELHDLQPLFERGLWIFGPEFESASFTSNQTLARVVEQFFGTADLTTPRKRPDFVVLPEASIGVYSADAFDGDQAIGFDKVIIVELKRGGSDITGDEKHQAHKYATELRRTGKVGMHTPIVCHVLGSTVDPLAQENQYEGKTTIIPRAYSVLLRQAHARTFHLLKKIQGADKWQSQDPDLNAVLEDTLLDVMEAPPREPPKPAKDAQG